MSLHEIFSRMKRYNENARVIFDRDEPLGCPTDLVLPEPRWSLFRRGARGNISSPSLAKPNERS